MSYLAQSRPKQTTGKSKGRLKARFEALRKTQTPAPPPVFFTVWETARRLTMYPFGYTIKA